MAPERQAPLRARLHLYQLTKAEFSLLTAMCEHSSDGSMVHAAIRRIAAYAKMSRRHADRLIHGYVDKRTGKEVPGLVKRGILTRMAKPGTRKRTAIYRINELALHESPEVRSYVEQASQMELPGIVKTPKSGAAQQVISDLIPQSNTPFTVDTVSSLGGHGVQPEVDTVSSLGGHGVHRFKSSYSNPIDSKPSDSQTGDPRRGVLNIPIVDANQEQRSQTQPISGQVREIAALHPKIRDAFHLPAEVYSAIAKAITRDGRDLVWAGTKSMAEAVSRWPRDEIRFLPSALNFFTASHYRADPAEWERKQKGGKGDDYAQRCEDEREILRRRQQSRGASA